MKNIEVAKKVRVTLDVSFQFYERLERLTKLVEADSKSALIRQSLQLYEYMARRSAEGYTFKAVRELGRKKN
jgi:hypothetical protein